MKVSLIAAVASNGVIGRGNTLPWRIRDDMRFFKEKTTGHVVITGRKNYEAMGRPLPNRDNIVVTTNQNFEAPGVTVCSSVEQALRVAEQRQETEAFVIGGAQLYAAALPYAHCYYWTRVLADVPGDVSVPLLDRAQWEVQELAAYPKNEHNEHACVIEQWTRKDPPRSYGT
jgi:dihydrofolate reductase